MKILVIALDCDGLAWVLRCQLAGHEVKVWFPSKNTVGDGMITKVPEWRPHMKWADLIFLTENAKLGKELELYFKQNYPIMGANLAGAELELDRCKGQEAFENAGIDTAGYEEFTDLGKAAAYVKKENRAFVMKPWGGTSDKALSYVPPKGYEVEAMIWKLERCKKDGLKGNFILQECVRGTEMGASGWFGPGGFSRWIEEDWEEKKLCSSGLGPNTGEMGTILRHVKKSKLADEMLFPLEEQLHDIGYVGNINVNCGIDENGKPWPYELTMRPGWPDFDILQHVIEGDPAEWMLDMLEGKDTLKMSTKTAVGVLMAHGDFPRGETDDEEAVGYPIYGIDEKNAEHISPSMVRVKDGQLQTAGTYVLIVCATDDSVSGAAKQVYDIAKEIKWAGDIIYRDDIGERLKKQLPILQGFGYAKGMVY